jgi:hypothetical protein
MNQVTCSRKSEPQAHNVKYMFHDAFQVHPQPSLGIQIEAKYEHGNIFTIIPEFLI